MKKKLSYVILPLLIIAAVFSFGLTIVHADEEPTTTTTETLTNERVKVYVFRGEGCSHCAEALAWFESVQEKEGKYFELVTFEVWNDEANKAQMEKVAKYFGENADGVPYIIVGKKTWHGFASSYSSEILDAIHSEYQKNTESRFDVIEYLKENNGGSLGTYIILVIAFLVIVFVIVARNGNNETLVNFEEEEAEEDEKEVHEEVKHKVTKKVKVEDDEPAKKTTKKTTKKATSKKNK
jgi:glutaredoxin